MSRSRPNILIRIWLGFWRGLTAFRIAVFNILFLLVLALIIGAIFSGDDGLVLEDDTTLVLSPRGVIVEEYTGTAMERFVNEALGSEVPETRLRDVLEVLEQARGDAKVTQVLIDTDRMLGVGAGVMVELNDAFRRFRQSGKPVIAYGGYMAQGQYFLASQADEIWLDNEGIVLLQGYSRFRNYYAEGLDMLDVEVNLFQTGDFKSAAEPYVRNDMSEADRQASEVWLAELWQNYLEMVAMNRGMPVQVLDDLSTNFSAYFADAEGNMAEMALEEGLVDRLVSRPELRAELARSGAADQDTGYRRVVHSEYLTPELPAVTRGDRIGVIVAEGPIMDGVQPPGSIGGESTSRLVRQAARDDNVRAVVLRVNSGGGSAVASEMIRRELMALKEAGKPVVVSMGDVAASGGYWIAMGADEVWAYPTTITGSIGVIGVFPTFEQSLKKIGVHTDGVGTTPLAGALRPDLSMSDEVRQLLQTFIEATYQDFLGLVAQSRQMTVDEVREVAQGRVWSGADAQERGLIDQLGGLEDAIASAARIAGLGEDFTVDYIEPQLEPWQQFLTQLGASALVHAGYEPTRAGWWAMLPPELRRSVANDLRLILDQARSGRPAVLAHCLCESPK
jgi:protease-4